MSDDTTVASRLMHLATTLLREDDKSPGTLETDDPWPFDGLEAAEDAYAEGHNDALREVSRQIRAALTNTEVVKPFHKWQSEPMSDEGPTA